MHARLLLWLRSLLIAVDQCACVLLAGPKYILVGGRLPNPRETISSRVGRRAIAGARWALLAEQLIDRAAVRLGDAPGHCRRMIVAADDF